jgi:hypothetical protein
VVFGADFTGPDVCWRIGLSAVSSPVSLDGPISVDVFASAPLPWGACDEKLVFKAMLSWTRGQSQVSASFAASMPELATWAAVLLFPVSSDGFLEG